MCCVYDGCVAKFVMLLKETVNCNKSDYVLCSFTNSALFIKLHRVLKFTLKSF